MTGLRTPWFALLGALFLLVLGCPTGDDDDSAAGDDDAGDDDSAAGDDDVDDDDTVAMDPQCDDLEEGMNTGFVVDGEERSFILTFPDGVDEGGPWPVVFNFHGLGDTAENMESLIAGEVNNAEWPFILVTPEDTDYLMFNFPLDWAVFEVDENNKEARLFDEVLACVEGRWGVDENAIHLTGFSIGSICCDMLGTIRGEQIASIATYSGGYWNNPANEDPLISWAITWPEYETQNQYVQLFVHGGENDYYDLMVTGLPFYEYAANDSEWLRGLGHDTILCGHTAGHTVPFSFRGDKLVRFFADHPLGTTTSPYASAGLPDELPDICEFLGATD